MNCIIFILLLIRSKQMSHYIREKQHYENVFDELYE